METASQSHRKAVHPPPQEWTHNSLTVVDSREEHHKISNNLQGKCLHREESVELRNMWTLSNLPIDDI